MPIMIFKSEPARRSGLRLWMLAAVFAFAAVGCRTSESLAPDSPVGQFLVVEGSARVDPAKYSDKIAWTTIFNGPLEATVETPLDPTVQDAGQRLLVAEAAARRDGMRALASRILALPDAGKKPLGQSVGQTPDLASAFEQLIRDQSKIKIKTTAQNAQAVAGIDGQAVLALFRQHGISFQAKLSELAPDEQEALKREAYNLAVADLRNRLREQIMGLKDRNDQPLRASFEAHSDRASALERMLLILQADTTKFEDDGTCRVQSYFDPDKARDLASGGAPWWAFWR